MKRRSRPTPPPAAPPRPDLRPVDALAVQAGRLLTAARKEAGRSRSAVATAAGLAPNSLRPLELGEVNPTLARLEEVAALYGVSLVLAAVPAGAEVDVAVRYRLPILDDEDQVRVATADVDAGAGA